MFLKNNSKIPLDKFINKALYDTNNGYYMNKNPIGHEGDFMTSPNISILFSEMITIWLISFWENMGCPKNINIIELGAGNGEMMLQILKSIEKFNKFKSSSNFFIYEKSPYLKKLQKNKINFKNIKWIKNLRNISKFPSIFIANEFFDALPIKQFLNKNNYWYEKYIINKDKSLEFFEKKNKKRTGRKINKSKIKKKPKIYRIFAFSKSKIKSHFKNY